jgi:hypothetical protein
LWVGQTMCNYGTLQCNKWRAGAFDLFTDYKEVVFDQLASIACCQVAFSCTPLHRFKGISQGCVTCSEHLLRLVCLK